MFQHSVITFLVAQDKKKKVCEQRLLTVERRVLIPLQELQTTKAEGPIFGGGVLVCEMLLCFYDSGPSSFLFVQFKSEST
jgi:hypothetical protein